MRDRRERPGQGQRRRDRGRETKQSCRGAESRRHSKKREAGGQLAGAPPEARLLGRCRAEERQLGAGIRGPGVKSAAFTQPWSHHSVLARPDQASVTSGDFGDFPVDFNCLPKVIPIFIREQTQLL